MTSGYSLLFDGDIELYDGEDESGTFWFTSVAEGTSFGDPSPVEVAVASLLRDGSLVERTGNGNREVTLRVTINSTDPVGLAEGRARLDRATGKRTTLVWQDGDYPATVFLVETSAIVPPGGFDDLEYLRNQSTVGLRLTCLPFTRSEVSHMDDADTPPSEPGVVLASLDTTTGWSSWDTTVNPPNTAAPDFAADAVVKAEGTASVKSRATYFDDDYFNGLAYAWNKDKVTGLSLDTDTGGYLAISIRMDHQYFNPSFQSGLLKLWMTVGGVETEIVSFTAIGRDDQDFVRYAWPVDAGLTVTGLRFQVDQYPPVNAGVRPSVRYDAIELLPSATTDKQIVKNLEVLGSARTVGSLLVSSPNDAIGLGEVLVVTAPTAELPAGFLPDGRRWAIQGTTVVDTDAPSGAYYSATATSYSSAAGTPIFEVPASNFTPSPYVAVLCGEPQSATPFAGVQAQLSVDGTVTGTLSTAEEQFASAETGTYQFFPVGTLYLPPTPVLTPDSTIKVRFLFAATDFRLDNLYLIPAWQVGGRPVADFSIVDCGTGTVEVGGASAHLWLDSPDAQQPQGGYWRGPSSSKTLAQSAWPDATKPGLHVFEPGELTAFVVSTNAQGPRVKLTYFPSWHGSAAL